MRDSLGKPQKKSSLNGRAIKREGGVKGRAIKEKHTFLTFFSNVPTFQRPLNLRGGGGLSLNGRKKVLVLMARPLRLNPPPPLRLNGRAIKRRIFFAASLRPFLTIAFFCNFLAACTLYIWS